MVAVAVVVGIEGALTFCETCGVWGELVHCRRGMGCADDVVIIVVRGFV